MNSTTSNVKNYINAIDKKWVVLFHTIYRTISENIPKSFKQTMSYGMIGFVVSLKIYPKGYHANPQLPLPFINLAVQKNHIAVYHMGLYGNKELLNWFKYAHQKEIGKKLNIEKACMRYKSLEDFSIKKMKVLMKKISVQDYIKSYENARTKRIKNKI